MDREKTQKLWIKGKEPFSHSFLPFTHKRLLREKHIGDVKEENASILILDGMHSGLGNASCGQDCMQKYRVSVRQMAGNLQFSARECGKYHMEDQNAGFEKLWGVSQETVSTESCEREEQFDPSDVQIRKKAGF